MGKNNLHPLTLKSMESLCSCRRDAVGGWRLCQYHQGYEDAAQAQQERLDEAVGLLRDIRRWFTDALGADSSADLLAAMNAFLARIDGGGQPNG